MTEDELSHKDLLMEGSKLISINQAAASLRRLQSPTRWVAKWLSVLMPTAMSSNKLTVWSRRQR